MPAFEPPRYIAIEGPLRVGKSTLARFLRERIEKKAAPGEARISQEYVEAVARAYDHFFFRYASSDLLVVNTSEIDFVNRNADLQQLLRRLEEPVKGTQYFPPLGDG